MAKTPKHHETHKADTRTIDLDPKEFSHAEAKAGEAGDDAAIPDPAGRMPVPDDEPRKDAPASPADISGENASQEEARQPAFREEPAESFAQEVSGGTVDGAAAEGPEQTPFSPPPPSRGGTSFLALLAAGLIGGVTSLGGAGVLNEAGMLSRIPLIGGLATGQETPATAVLASVSDLQAQIAALSARIDANGGDMASAAAISAIEARLAGLETSLKGLGGAAAGSTDIASLVETVRGARENADKALAQISDLSTRILGGSAGEAGVDAMRAAVAGATSELSGRIAALEAAQVNGGDVKASEIAQLRSRIDAIEKSGATRIEDRISVVQGEIGKQGEAISGLASRVDQIDATLASEVLAPMEEVRKAAQAALEGQRVARSVTARALTAAVEQGGGFAGELASAETLAGPGAAIEELKAIADRGLATPNELAEAFGPVRDAITASIQQPEDDAGVVARFIASARSLVKVRPSGPLEGDSREAILSRVEASLEAGDLDRALSEWNALPDTDRQEGEAFQQALADRIRLGQSIRQVIDSLSADGKGQE